MGRGVKRVEAKDRGALPLGSRGEHDGELTTVGHFESCAPLSIVRGWQMQSTFFKPWALPGWEPTNPRLGVGLPGHAGSIWRAISDVTFVTVHTPLPPGVAFDEFSKTPPPQFGQSRRLTVRVIFERFVIRGKTVSGSNPGRLFCGPWPATLL